LLQTALDSLIAGKMQAIFYPPRFAGGAGACLCRRILYPLFMPHSTLHFHFHFIVCADLPDAFSK